GDYKSCSCSHLVHMISALLKHRTQEDDLINLIGLKGDWAIEPATDFVSDYVRPFFDDVKGSFQGLLEKKQGEPTLFEVKQREKTTLLNQIAEAVFALGGGGFQYFYNDRDETLKNADQAFLSYQLLERAIGEKTPVFRDRSDFLERMEDGRALKIWRFFQEDWKKTEDRFRNCFWFRTLRETDIYLFWGNGVSLMPMVGSVALYQLPLKGGKERILIMINHLEENGLHFSLRSTGGKFSCGDLAYRFVQKMLEKIPEPSQITGGGHPFAAEVRTRRANADPAFVLETFFSILKEN
ncbi:MAG TPA: hypothetical protein VJC03_03595, partial [bacterium]|nr:hypothetical protein [bacterium]